MSHVSDNSVVKQIKNLGLLCEPKQSVLPDFEPNEDLNLELNAIDDVPNMFEVVKPKEYQLSFVNDKPKPIQTMHSNRIHH